MLAYVWGMPYNQRTHTIEGTFSPMTLSLFSHQSHTHTLWLINICPSEKTKGIKLEQAEEPSCT